MSEQFEIKAKPQKEKMDMRPNFELEAYADIVPMERLQVAAEEESDLQRNCFGTAQFLSGENQHGDRFEAGLDTVKMLDEREQISEPEIGCYVVLDGLHDIPTSITHMGVVVSTEPLQLMHRIKRQGPLRVDSIEEVVAAFHKKYESEDIPTYNGIEVRYYRNSNTHTHEKE